MKNENEFMEAIEVIRRTIQSLPEEDRDDFRELIELMIDDDTEEMESANAAALEIIRNEPIIFRGL